MNEHQQLEYKHSWRDEYLKWICGFANASGGVLVIGKDDCGVPVGVPDAAKLLEDLPNKIRDVLGVMVAVNLFTEADKDMIEIRVDAYPSPISRKGHYYLRSGSTNQALKGAALDRFLMRKQGRTWDSIPVPYVGIDDLSSSALARFRALAKQGRRLETALLDEPNAALIEKLHLLDGSHLKRAAVLLFHPDPERFITGAFVKLGYFRTESELVYHDEVHGDLFAQAQETLDMLFSKYLKAVISYRGIHRIESLPVPEEALREAILNALIHRDYAIGAPIQIRVYADRLKIWNAGELPDNWTVEKLMQPHSSRPFNPTVANAFFRAGKIEAWGRGIQRIVDACRDAEAPKPTVTYTPGDLWIEFPFSNAYLDLLAAETAPSENPAAKASVKASVKTSVKILALLDANPEMTLADVASVVGRTVRAVELASSKLVKAGKLKYVGPQKGGHWEVLK